MPKRFGLPHPNNARVEKKRQGDGHILSASSPFRVP